MGRNGTNGGWGEYEAGSAGPFPEAARISATRDNHRKKERVKKRAGEKKHLNGKATCAYGGVELKENLGSFRQTISRLTQMEGSSRENSKRRKKGRWWNGHPASPRFCKKGRQIYRTACENIGSQGKVKQNCKKLRDS